MMGVSWTDKQSEVIETRNKNILVSASAGSGKTAVLVERIKRLIIDERVSIDEILVATFTNAAASDMKEKIIKAIQKAILENKANEQFLKSQFDKVYKANINTFHSFAISVIRRYFYVINVDPDFKICDDAEKTILQTEAMDELFEEKFDSGSQAFIDFLTTYCGAKSEKKAKDMIFYLYESIQALPEPFEWLSSKTAIPGGTDEELHEHLFGFILDEVIANLEYALSAFKTVYDVLETNGIASLALKASRDIEAVQNIVNSAEAGAYEAMASQLRTLKFETFTAGKEEKAIYDEIKDQVGKIRGKGKGYIKELQEDYFSTPFEESAERIRSTYESSKTLMGLVLDFDKAYKEKKKEKTLLDFNDIEHYALEILKNPDVSKEYQKKFKYIFVDEYQDSNLLQEAMVNLIKRDDNVFMVGDVKQSIYKFRLAEPEIFIQKYEAYKHAHNEKDIKIDLSTNFRCKGNIIDLVNDTCAKIMPYDEDSALRKGVSYTGDLDYPVELHMVETKEVEDAQIDRAINEMKKVELEASIVSKLIKKAVGNPIYEDGKGERPTELKDIVILMRSVKSVGEKYYQILMENNLPAFIDDSEGYFDTIEIEIFMNLLKVIDNKRRDIPLISVLHSKIMGFDADELAAIRIASRAGSYYGAFERYGVCGDDIVLREKCRKAHETIEEWRSLMQIMPLDELVWKLMWDTGYYIYIGALAGGEQRQANLRALVDKSLKYMKMRPDGGLYGFIQYAEILRRKGVQTGQVSLTSEGDNVVRIKTIHKSKGLEFPVVILSGLGKRFMSGREKSDVYMHKNIGYALSCYDTIEKKQQKTLLQTVIANKNKNESMDEEARILYVALTRAKDRLFLVGTVPDAEKAMESYALDIAGGKGASCYLDMVAPVFLEKNLNHEIHTRSDVSIQTKRGSDFKEAFKRMLTGSAELSSDVEMKKTINDRLSYEYPYQKDLVAKSKYSVSELGNAKLPVSREKTIAVPLFVQGKKKLTSAEIGSALHTVMEKLDFKKASEMFALGNDDGYAYVKGLIEELREKVILTDDEADAIDTKRIEMFIKSDIGKRLAKADNIYKEVPFNIVKEIDGIETIIQGVIDCYFEEGGEYTLIDYKSGYVSGEDDIERIKQAYAQQVELYGEALEITKNIQVKEKYLYLFSKDITVSLA